MKPDEIISDAEVDHVHGNANFGSTPKRDVIAHALLKTACGYSTGHTARTIIEEHGLVGSGGDLRKLPRLRKKGREYLWAALGQNSV